jgi:ATP synthase protein I
MGAAADNTGTTGTGTGATGTGPGRVPGGTPPPATGEPRAADEPGRPPETNAGWSVFSYLLSGMLFYGLAGWIASQLSHIAILFPVGALVGLVAGIVLVIYRYGRA